MKLTLTEQALKNMVHEGIMETVHDVRIGNGTWQHFTKKSDTVKRLNEFEKLTGWRVALVKDDEATFTFIMVPSDTAERVISRERYIDTMTDAIQGMISVEPMGPSNVAIVIDKNKSYDYKNSVKYATDMYNGKGWKTPWGFEDKPAGVPETK